MNHIILFDATCIRDDIRKLYTGEIEFTALVYDGLMKRLESIRQKAMGKGFVNLNLSSLEPRK